MKKGVIIGIVIAVLIIGAVTSYLSLRSKNPSEKIEIPEGANIIKIENFAYSPQTLTIKQGESVTWINGDSAIHTVTSDSGSELDSELLSKDDSYAHTFNEKGVFDYHCTPHPYMTGTIVVE